MTHHKCPRCGSDDLRWDEYDGGIDSETGYHDAGELYICEDCGDSGPAEDAEVTEECCGLRRSA